jgi:malate/lactate dehydrogenase
MLDVAILGAGPLGGSIAHVLARRDIATTIRLIDERSQIAAGKALDIMQSSPSDPFSTFVSGSQDMSSAASASVIVLADRAEGGEWQGDEGRLLLTSIRRMGSRRLVVCAGASQRELVDRGVAEAAFASSAIVGTAPEALASALRAMLALEADRSVNDISLMLLGVPPSQVVVPWEDVTIGGLAAVRVLDEPARRRVAAKLAPLWPPGPHALANAVAEALACVAGQSRRVLSCFTAPDRQDAGRMQTIARPVRLNGGGATPLELPSLSPNARVALDNALNRAEREIGATGR